MTESPTKRFKLDANIAPCYLKTDRALWPLVSENFQAITPDHAFTVKRCFVHGDEPDFEITDWLCEKIKDSGLELHGHCLLHGGFALGRWTELGCLEFEATLKRAIQSICDRYRGIVTEWEFLGEVVSPLGGLTNTFLKRMLGLDFPVKIFRWIREVDPDVPLYYTDYGLESADKLESVLRFCQYLTMEGCNLSGVAIQYHHNTKGAINRLGLKKAIRSIQMLFLKAKISELTIWRDLATLGDLAENIQAHCYEKSLELAIETKCESVTFWSPFDAYCWKASDRHPGLWGFNYEETESLKRIKKVMKKLDQSPSPDA